MPHFPPGSAKMRLREHVHIRKNVGQRVIDPATGHQFEVTHDEVEYTCPICRTLQAAPVAEGVDYECPQCKWRYKVYGEMLVVWSSKTVGVETSALPPGAEPHDMVIDAAISDQDRVSAEYAKSTADWREGKNEDWGKKIQVTTPKETKT